MKNCDFMQIRFAFDIHFFCLVLLGSYTGNGTYHISTNVIVNLFIKKLKMWKFQHDKTRDMITIHSAITYDVISQLVTSFESGFGMRWSRDLPMNDAMFVLAH